MTAKAREREGGGGGGVVVVVTHVMKLIPFYRSRFSPSV